MSKNVRNVQNIKNVKNVQKSYTSNSCTWFTIVKILIYKILKVLIYNKNYILSLTEKYTVIYKVNFYQQVGTMSLNDGKM